METGFAPEAEGWREGDESAIKQALEVRSAKLSLNAPYNHSADMK